MSYDYFRGFKLLHSSTFCVRIFLHDPLTTINAFQNVSKFLEHFKEMFPWYYIHSYGSNLQAHHRVVPVLKGLNNNVRS